MTEPTVDLTSGTVTRTEETYRRLASMAHRLGPNAQLPTFAELKGQLGVSVVTLNRALERLETHQVLCRRHGVGIFVSPNLGRKSIAVVCWPRFFEGPEISPFWQILVDQLRREITDRQHGFSLHFGTTEDEAMGLQEDFQRSVEERRIHGVIGIGLSQESGEWLNERGVPAVGFAGGTRYRVEVDYQRLVREATDHLLTVGCDRIILSAPLGCEDRLRDAPISKQVSVVHLENLLSEVGDRPYPLPLWEQGYRTAQALFERTACESVPDGIVSTSELFSQGLLIGLQRIGVSIGTQVHLVTHANEGASILLPWADEIVRFEVSPRELAGTMLEMLETQFRVRNPFRRFEFIKRKR